MDSAQHPGRVDDGNFPGLIFGNSNSHMIACIRLPTHRPEFPNLEKGEFIYFMENHVEYEFDAFKEIFERFDEDGHLAALAHLTSRRKLADFFGCFCPWPRKISLFSWTYITQYPVFLL